MQTKAVFFDVDDTLFPSTRFAERARRNAVDAMIDAGLKVDGEKAYETLTKVIRNFGSNYPRHFNALLRELKLPEEPRIIAAAVFAYHNTKASIMPFPEVPRTLLELRDGGYRLYVASEGNSVKQWDKLIRLQLQWLFHDVFVSEGVGYEKSPEFYATILKKLKLRPAETVMVGDKVEKDVVAAKEAGMHTVLFCPYEQKRAKDADFSIGKMNELLQVLKKLK